MKAFTPTPMSGKDTLDKLILDCEHYGCFTFPTSELPAELRSRIEDKNCIKLGQLVFKARRHSTGCDVQVWVVLDNGETLQVRSVTYWYSGSYTFNKGFSAAGPWDKSIAVACDQMIGAILNARTRQEALKEEADKGKDESEQAVLDKFAKAFVQLMVLLLPLFSAGQSISYTYPQLGLAPCNQFLECGDSTCSACENGISSAPQFFGTPASWFGVTACPEVVMTGDDCINVEGWPTIPDSTARVAYSFLTMVPLYIDSVIITHRSSDLGRLQVRIGINTTTMQVVDDVANDPAFITTVITGLGCVAADSGNVFGTMRLHLQAYQGAGVWTIDALRLVATPCTNVGIEEHLAPGERRSGPSFDLLGRRSRVTFPF